MTRRRATRLIGGTAAGIFLATGGRSSATPGGLAELAPPADNASRSQSTRESTTMFTRAIPLSGEKLPVIGLGTWQVFDVDLTPENEKQLADVLSTFVKLGGRVIDSSPMYGRSEEVIGALATKLGIRDKLFLATKVWTRGKPEGAVSMERSISRFQTKRIDLMQVHNLVDVETQLATIREWQAQGKFRYVGVTHYNESAFPEVEKILQKEKVDFLQINYSIMEREAEQRILPLAQDRKIAVLVNRPFGGGDLFGQVRSKPVPEWATEFDCKSWGQFFLKWIVSNPAVTCAIPATNKVDHLKDNMQGGTGRLPDAKMRQRMTEFVSAL